MCIKKLVNDDFQIKAHEKDSKIRLRLSRRTREKSKGPEGRLIDNSLLRSGRQDIHANQFVCIPQIQPCKPKDFNPMLEHTLSIQVLYASITFSRPQHRPL